MLAELFMGNASLEAGASAKWDNRYLVPGTELDDIAHLLSRLREGDSVRRYIGCILSAAHAPARRAASDHPATYAAMRSQHRMRRGQRMQEEEAES